MNMNTHHFNNGVIHFKNLEPQKALEEWMEVNVDETTE
jgi:hypothetical protein